MGHAYVDRLLCPSGQAPQRPAVTTKPAATAGCLTDSYQLACDDGSNATVEIAGGLPFPPPPKGWILLDSSEQAAWRSANGRAAECPKCSEELLGKLIRDHPDVPSFLRLRGVTRTAQKRIGEAVDDLDRAVTLAPGNRLYRLERAELRLRLGQTAPAIGELLALDRDADPSWKFFLEWLEVTARTLQRAGDPRAPAFLQRACAAGIKGACPSEKPPRGN